MASEARQQASTGTTGPAPTGRRHEGRHEIPLSLGMSLVTLGIVYGDLGTSPLYATKAIVRGQGGIAAMDQQAVIGFLSLIIWTVTLITTVKYVLVAMRADNHGEGGIFSLYNVVRRHWKGLTVIAMLGGSAFLADSVLTPAVSITSAVEGLRTIPVLASTQLNSTIAAVVISVIIIVALFTLQQAGTAHIGRYFGPAMLVWFSVIALIGVVSLVQTPQVLAALNPLAGVSFLLSGDNHAGFAILGSVFLSVTGAEALYSDMGHVGRPNIYATWPLVKLALLLNYLGQGAWILRSAADPALAAVPDLNPFFQMLPEALRPVMVALSIMAGVIASQALISGAFTMVSEADGLMWLPRLPISYPGEAKGQIYIPSVCLVMGVCTSLIVVFFQTSSNMEAAYGLALTLTMLCTTALLFVFVWKEWRMLPLAVVMAAVFGFIELLFFLSSLVKFLEGGYVAILMAAFLFGVMLVYHKGNELEHVRRRRVAVSRVLPLFEELARDSSLPRLADNLVFLTPDTDMKALDCDIVASALRNGGKRAATYWVVTVTQSDAPYACSYSLDSYGGCRLFRVRIRLGYKVPQYLLSNYVEQIMEDQLRDGMLTQRLQPHAEYAAMLEASRSNGAEERTTREPLYDEVGLTRYVILRKEISPESDLPDAGRTIVRLHRAIDDYGSSPVRWFGLELTDPIVERIVLCHGTPNAPRLRRVALRGQRLEKRPSAAVSQAAVPANLADDDPSNGQA